MPHSHNCCSPESLKNHSRRNWLKTSAGAGAGLVAAAAGLSIVPATASAASLTEA